jgi:hypothetical protein
MFYVAFALAVTLSLTGCMTASVKYSLADVRPVYGGLAGKINAFRQSTLYVEPFKDSRYSDKKSVSAYIRKSGMYGAYRGESHEVGLRPTPEMSDYRDIFRGVPYSPETSYYCAPDRLYWVGNGPLTGMREILAEHIAKTLLFRAVTVEEKAKCDYALKLEAKRFLSLKERRPVVDVVDILWTGFLFSSDEVVSAEVAWSLVRQSDGKVVASGVADSRSVENHHCYAAQNKPFKLNKRAAREIGTKIVADLEHAAVAPQPR